MNLYLKINKQKAAAYTYATALTVIKVYKKPLNLIKFQSKQYRFVNLQ